MKAVRALVLVLALSVCAYAGIMPNDGRPEPAPTPTATEESNAGLGGIDGDTETSEAPTDVTTEAALNLIGAVLALL